jgi:hypothetical protein
LTGDDFNPRHRWRFLIATLLVTPVFLTYIISRIYVPVTEQFAWIEFTSLWTMIGQITGIALVGIWGLFWSAHDRLQMMSPDPGEKEK